MQPACGKQPDDDSVATADLDTDGAVLLRAINRLLHEALSGASEETLAQISLDAARDCTRSELGLVGRVNEAGHFEILASLGMDRSAMPDGVLRSEPGGVYPCGVWARPLRQQRSVILNEVDATDDCTALAVQSFLGMPLIWGGQAIGLLALANAADGYRETQLADLEALATALGEALHRKQAEAALQLNERRLETLRVLDQMSGASLRELTDFALEQAVQLTQSTVGYLAFVNEDETVLTMHGWSNGALRQCAIAEKPIIYPVDSTGLWGEAVRQRRPICTNDYRVSNPLKHGFPDGHVPLLRHLNAPIFDGARIVLVVGVGNKPGPYDDADARQLTLLMQGMWQLLQRRRDAEQLARRADELAAVNKELEAFSYSVSHDLRSPLRRIEGFAQVLLEEHAAGLGEEGQGCLQRICQATERMRQLIEDLLNFAQLASQPLEEGRVSLSWLADGIVEELRRSDPHREVEFSIAPGITTRGDEHLLQIVLRQFLENAWKFTGKRRRARIEFGTVTLAEQQTYFVRDNGAGFDMKHADRLFGAFQRLHSVRDFPGTGVGLATAQRIIHRHGGRVWAEGAVDHGATFYFTLDTGERRRP